MVNIVFKCEYLRNKIALKISSRLFIKLFLFLLAQHPKGFFENLKEGGGQYLYIE